MVSDCLLCDSKVVPGSRFSGNLLKTLRDVKKRAMLFWMVIIGNGLMYIAKPFLLPGRHFMDDVLVLYGLFFDYFSPIFFCLENIINIRYTVSQKLFYIYRFGAHV